MMPPRSKRPSSAASAAIVIGVADRDWLARAIMSVAGTASSRCAAVRPGSRSCPTGTTIRRSPRDLHLSKGPRCRSSFRKPFDSDGFSLRRRVPSLANPHAGVYWMMNHIDLSSVLRQTLACDLYSNLVTRPTGAAVRGQIEEILSDSGPRALTVIDFSHVSMIDLSCADEVVAKLLLRYGSEDSPQEAYFLFRGVTEHHHDAIEAVLERHELVAALEEADGVRLVGSLSDDEGDPWGAACSPGGGGGGPPGGGAR